MEKCCACKREFVAGDRVITFNLTEVKIGEKSGQLGFYPAKECPELDYVHFSYQCLEKCFSPADNPFLYDVTVTAIRKEVTEDVRDEIYEEFEMDIPPLHDVDNPPYCLFCKKKESMWIHISLGGAIYHCSDCKEYWDEDENPVLMKAA